MNRKEFIVGCASIIGSQLLSSYGISTPDFPLNELIGKQKPDLYGKGFLLRKEAYQQFMAMKESAKKSGFNIHVISSYRSYQHQNSIWQRKYNRYKNQGFQPEQRIQKIIEYSTIPGTSRHHWGTDLDVVDASKGIPKNPLHEKHFNPGGRIHQFKIWLDENACRFGFHEVYTNNPNRKGFSYEPWHLSYQPLSVSMLKEYKQLNIKQILQQNQLVGSKYFSDNFIDQYTKQNILDINPKLLPL